MEIAKQIAKHLRDVYSGGNWTWVNLKDTLADVDWQQATARIHDCNSIATLVYHIGYFVTAVIQVLEGGPLDAKDKYSFDHPPINNAGDWQRMLDKTWSEGERFASLIEQLPDSRLAETFTDEKYGNYYRNLQGIIEHIHYHMGQIVILKKVMKG